MTITKHNLLKKRTKIKTVKVIQLLNTQIKRNQNMNKKKKNKMNQCKMKNMEKMK